MAPLRSGHGVIGFDGNGWSGLVETRSKDMTPCPREVSDWT